MGVLDIVRRMYEDSGEDRNLDACRCGYFTGGVPVSYATVTSVILQLLLLQCC